jgi:hypothetical protein
VQTFEGRRTEVFIRQAASSVGVRDEFTAWRAHGRLAVVGDGQVTRVWSRNPTMETSWQAPATAASVSLGRPAPGTLRSVIVCDLSGTATKTYDGPTREWAAKLSLNSGTGYWPVDSG